MLPPDLVEAIEEDHRALDAFVLGDPEPKKKMFSHRKDLSVANPLGPPVVGWDQVERPVEGSLLRSETGNPTVSSTSPGTRRRIWRTSWRSSVVPESRSGAPKRASRSRCA